MSQVKSRRILSHYGRKWSPFFFYSVYLFRYYSYSKTLLYTHPQNTVWPNIWAPHSSVKLTHKLNPTMIYHFPILYLLQEGCIKSYEWSIFLVYSDISNYYSSWKWKVKDISKPLNWFAIGSYRIWAKVCHWILEYSEAKGI